VGRTTRVVVSVGLLAAIVLALDPAPIVSRLLGMEVGWVAVALVLGTLQVVLSAWRWRFTARRLGLRLTFRDAVREYYMATFLNQTLPGGVTGDVSRAWRHGRDPGAASMGRAVRAVVLERASGQVVMVTAALVSVLALTPSVRLADLFGGLAAVFGTAGGAEAAYAGPSAGVGPVLVGTALIVAAGGGLAALLRGRHRPRGLLRRITRDSYDALLAPRALPVQLVTSAVVVGSYLALGVVAARAVGVETPTAVLLPLVAPVLIAMLLPITVAGWGVREGAAALLWSTVGLPAEDGVAIFVAYGLLALVASLPGAFLLPAVVGRGPGQKGWRPEADRRAWASAPTATSTRPAAKVEVEEDVVAERQVTAGRPERLVEGVDRVEGERGPAGSHE